MDTITIVSQDGESAVVIVQNWKEQGRPAILINSINESGVQVSAEMPLDPGVVIELVRLFQEAEHHMVRFLCQHIAQETEKDQEEKTPAPVLQMFKGK